MKPFLRRSALALRAAAAAGLLCLAPSGLPARPADRAADDAAAPRPAPPWLKVVDQGDLDPRLKGYKTPDGFKVEIVAEEPLVANPVEMAFADDGAIYVVERPRGADSTPGLKDGIHVLSDRAGKGIYNMDKVVFEDEKARGLLLHDGWLYVRGGGKVRRYRRSKGDGPFDVREVVAQGFCEVCGVSVGPDGRLYLSAAAGDNDVEGSDGSRATSLQTGAVFRCRPDGSKMETYAIGFRQPVGPVAFDAAGNAFQADAGDPPDKDGPFAKCRVMHLLEGADFGFWTNDPFRAAANGEPPMPAMSRGRCGGLLIYNDARLPDSYRGLVFAPDYAPKTPRSVHAYKVERKGSTFEVARDFDFLKSDDPLFWPVQVALGPDGAVYVVDCRDPDHGEHGRIYRITWAGTKDQAALPPGGMDSWAEFAKLDDNALIKAILSDGDREHVRRELVKRGEKERPALLKVLKDAEQADAARIAALGALESLWDGEVQAAALFALQKDSSADVRRFAADAVGSNAARGDDDVQSGLLRALNDVAPEVRRSVALAMSHVGAAAAPDNLVNAWAFEESPDAYLRDGLVRAVENLGKPGIDRLVALGESGVTKETDKVVEAFTMMRTRPAADALPRVLENPHLTAAHRAALIRSYHNYLLDPPVSLDPAVDYLTAHPKEDAEVKVAGLQLLASDGGARGDKAVAWASSLLGDKDPKVRLAAFRAVPAKARAGAAPLLKEIVTDDKTAGLRSEALRDLAECDAPAARALARTYVEKKDPVMTDAAVAVLAGDADGARFLGRIAADKKLPPEALPLVSGALRRFADKDPECARLLKELSGKE